MSAPDQSSSGTVGSSPDAAQALTSQFVLQVEGLAVSAGGRTVLEELNFVLGRGEILALIGPSGCGKSTLLRHLCGLDLPLAGRVRSGALDVHDDSPQTARLRRERFGVMFQAGALWGSMSVGENLMLTLRVVRSCREAEQRDRARAMLARVGLAQSFDMMPAALSGGMRKRVALARALVHEPTLAFLDEPGSGLDPETEARMDELILSLRAERSLSVVMVSHSVASVLRVADRAIYLDPQVRSSIADDTPGVLRAEGPPQVRRFFMSPPARA
jgi:phospholipid/cholesterol/gamma-HCH transport system ATP-binding protein